MSNIRWEIDALIQRWFDAYPVSVFPEPKRPPLPEETAYAVMLARHILQSLSVEIEAICMDHERTKSAPSVGTKWIPWSGGEQPVDSHTLVEVAVRSSPNEPISGWAWEFDWTNDDLEPDEEIIKYRVVEET